MAKAMSPGAILRQAIQRIQSDNTLDEAGKKRAIQIVREVAQVEGVTIAKDGEKEADVWKGILLQTKESGKKE